MRERMETVRVRAVRPFRLKPGGPWIAKEAILHLLPRKAMLMRKRGNVEPLDDKGLEEMQPGFYPKQTREPCKPCGKKKE